MTITKHSEHRARMTEPFDIYRYCLSGNATVTIVSTKTNTRYTFKVRAPMTKGKKRVRDFEAKARFVSQTGPNEKKWFIGTCFTDSGNFRYSRKSKLQHTDPAVRAFEWFWGQVTRAATSMGGALPADLEVWHEGSCGKCGRALTVPESIARGIGPVCSGEGYKLPIPTNGASEPKAQSAEPTEPSASTSNGNGVHGDPQLIPSKTEDEMIAEDWAQYRDEFLAWKREKDEYAQREREQEAAAFMAESSTWNG